MSANIATLKFGSLVGAVRDKGQTLDLVIYWRSIAKRKWRILSAAVVIAALTGVAVSMQTPIYRSTVTLLIEQSRARVAPTEAVYTGVGDTREHFQTQAEILKARALAMKVVDKLDLTNHPDFDPRKQERPLLERIKKDLGFDVPEPAWTEDALHKAVVTNQVNAVVGLGYVFTSNSLRARVLRPIIRALFRQILRMSHGRMILQNSDDQDLFLKNRLVAPDSIRVIRGSGVNTARFCLQRQEDRQSKCLRVLMATRLLWEKGVGEYAEAARQLKPILPDVEFLLAGVQDDGNPSSVPDAIIARWQEEGIINALGHVENMAALLQSVDIAVLPSYREGTPRILLEAAASGLPIVATDVPGCREIVEHKVNGLLVPPKDPKALAEALMYIASHPKERRRMGEEGRRKVLEEFDERIVISKTMDVYRELLAFSMSVG